MSRPTFYTKLKKNWVYNQTPAVIALLAFCFISGCGLDNSTDDRVETEEPIYICSKCPQLTSSVDTLTYIGDVRRFVRKTIDIGLLESSTSVPLEKAWETNNLDRIIEVFEQDSGSANRHYTSELMTRILLSQGLSAYTINFGYRDIGQDHSLVLVKHRGTISIHSPEHNYVLLDGDGTYMDILNLIEQVGSNSLIVNVASDTVFSHLVLEKSLLQSNEQMRKGFNNPICLEYYGDGVKSRSTISKYRVPFCYGCNVSRPCLENEIYQFEKLLLERTSFQDFHEGIVINPEIRSSAADAMEILDQIKIAIYSQPYLGYRINPE